MLYWWSGRYWLGTHGRHPEYRRYCMDWSSFLIEDDSNSRFDEQSTTWTEDSGYDRRSRVWRIPTSHTQSFDRSWFSWITVWAQVHQCKHWGASLRKVYHRTHHQGCCLILEKAKGQPFLFLYLFWCMAYFCYSYHASEL